MRTTTFVCLFLLLPASSLFAGTANANFKLTSGMLIASTILDVETSMRAVDSCRDCSEANPVFSRATMKGRLPLYLMHGGIDAAAILGSYYLKKSNHRYWWMIPVAMSTAHFAAGGANLRFVF